MDDILQSLVNAPLADPGKINVPMGKRPAPRTSKVIHENFVDAVDRKTARQYRADLEATKQRQLLDYYCSSGHTPEQIHAFTKIPMETIGRAFEARGISPPSELGLQGGRAA